MSSRIMARPQRRRRWLWLFAAALVLLGPSAAVAQQSRLEGKLRSGDRVVVPAGERVTGDLYASGRLVRVEGTVDGDLIAAGTEVEVPGEVTGDLLAAGSVLDVSGRVGGDARIAGGRVTIAGAVGEDLVAAGGQVTLTPSGRVGQDLVFGAGQMTLDGQVAGSALGSTGSYTRRGTVAGGEDVTVGERQRRAPTFGDRALGALQDLVGVLLVAALLLWLLPRALRGTAEILRRRPLTSLGVGVLGMIGVVALVVIVFLVTVLLAVVLGLLGLGSLVGLVLLGAFVVLVVVGFLLYVTVAFVAPAAAGMTLGELALRPTSPGGRWGALALGVVVVVILTALPVVGGWIGVLVALFGLGAVLPAVNPWRRRAVAAPPG